jgi:inorganic triphosphatase YgiF
MTISEDRNVIAMGDNTAAEQKKRLHTDDIAGTAKPNSEVSSEVEQREGSADVNLEPLFAADVERDFRTRWRDIQSGFVDEPRSAVERADALVAQLMQRLAQSFSEQRKNLEKQWEESEKVSTEELRVALTRYRSFFERLLSI